MSALLTHVAVGLLLGMALRVPWRQLPLCALLAEVHDLDHLDKFLPFDVPGLETRVTFHNALFAVALPLAVWLALRRRGAPASWQRLAAVAPVPMASHLLLDMLTLDVASPRVPLFWPLARTSFTVPTIRAYAVDPTAYSTITLLLLLLVAIVALTSIGVRTAEQRPGARTAVAYTLAWMAVFPVLFATGFVTAAPPHADAFITLEDAAFHTPQDRLTAIVYHAGGADIGRGAVGLVFLDGETVVASAKNTVILSKGDRWFADLPAPPDAPSRLVARVEATSDGHVYADRPTTLARGHVDVPVAIDSFAADTRGRGTVVLRDAGAFPLPAGALRLVVEDADAVELHNGTNPDDIGPGRTWTTTFGMSPLAAAQGVRIRALAEDDGHVYLDEVRRPGVG